MAASTYSASAPTKLVSWRPETSPYIRSTPPRGAPCVVRSVNPGKTGLTKTGLARFGSSRPGSSKPGFATLGLAEPGRSNQPTFCSRWRSRAMAAIGAVPDQTAKKTESESTAKVPYKRKDPLHMQEIFLMGEAAQATYDTVELNDYSRNRDQNKYKKEELLDPSLDHLRNLSFFTELPDAGYTVTQYLKANEESSVIRNLLNRDVGKNPDNPVWMGYVAYSAKREDILVAWRGTQRPAEWLSDARLDMKTFIKYSKADAEAPTGNDGAPSKAEVTFTAGLVGAALTGIFPAVLLFLGGRIHSWLPQYQALDLFCGSVIAINAFIASVPVIETIVIRYDASNFGSNPLLLNFVYVILAIIAHVALSDPSGSYTLLPHFPALFLSVIAPMAIISGWKAGEGGGGENRVHGGFYELYCTGKKDDPDFLKRVTNLEKQPLPLWGQRPDWDDVMEGSPRKTLMTAVEALVNDPTKVVSTISVTGHSLGGALSILSSYDLARRGFTAQETTPGGAATQGNEPGETAPGNERGGKPIPVRCYSFEAPRVGGPMFVKDFHRLITEKRLENVRVENRVDVVTQVPKAFFFQNLFYGVGVLCDLAILRGLINTVERWTYGCNFPTSFQHATKGATVSIDTTTVKHIRSMSWGPWNVLGNLGLIGVYHNLETVLHVLSGFPSAPLVNRNGTARNGTDGTLNAAGILNKVKTFLGRNGMHVRNGPERNSTDGALYQNGTEKNGTDGKPKRNGTVKNGTIGTLKRNDRNVPDFGKRFTRDFALCNKSSDSLYPALGIAPNWFQTLTPAVVKAPRPRGGKTPALIEPYLPWWPDQDSEEGVTVGKLGLKSGVTAGKPGMEGEVWEDNSDSGGPVKAVKPGSKGGVTEAKAGSEGGVAEDNASTKGGVTNGKPEVKEQKPDELRIVGEGPLPPKDKEPAWYQKAAQFVADKATFFEPLLRPIIPVQCDNPHEEVKKGVQEANQGLVENGGSKDEPLLEWKHEWKVTAADKD